MAVLYTPHVMQFFDRNGAPLANGTLEAFVAGTNSVEKDMYTSAAAAGASSTISLDSSGRAVVFIDGSYRYELHDQAGNLIEETDGISSFTASASDETINNFSGIASATLEGADRLIFSNASNGGNSTTVTADVLQTLLTGGKTLQVVKNTTSSMISGNQLMGYDDSIPQITEGFEVITKSITPVSSNSKLYIEFYGTYNVNAGYVSSAALFVDSTADAIAAAQIIDGVSGITGWFYLATFVQAGNTTERTYKARVGTTNALGTIYINGDGLGNRVYGGVAATGITITEVL